MLRLDEDLADFHARCRQSETHNQAAETGFGRLLRSASLFEDIVKVICTCNVTWRQTVAMVDAIVKHWGTPINPPKPPFAKGEKKGEVAKGGKEGEAAKGGRKPGALAEHRHGDGTSSDKAPPCLPVRGFPTPARLAQVRESTLKRIARVGYRASFIHSLARDVADGRLDLTQFDRFEGPTDELLRLLRQIRGVGGYAAGHLSMLLGRYDCLAIDTEMVRLLEHLYPGRTWTPARMRAHYQSWQPYQFLAYWFELWQDYVKRHGDPERWAPDGVGQSITANSASKI